nr:putative reverse transcriptase domain-containing protein [Tanacetum cinerariifolium]
KDCHKLRNQHRGNQTRNKTRNKTGGNDVTAKAYAIGGGGTNPDSNVVMGTFLLNNCYASMLFDSGADRSLLLTTFSALLDVAPSTLDASYDVELADGRVLETIIVLRGCMLGLLGHPFNIDLMPVELGSFDVIIDMDWLAKYHALIVCDEKVIRITDRDEVLIIRGDNCDDESKLNIISYMKIQKYIQKGCQVYLAQVTSKKAEDKLEEKRLEDVPIIREFPEVFPEYFPRLPPVRQVKFQIDLVPGVAPVARAPSVLKQWKPFVDSSEFITCYGARRRDDEDGGEDEEEEEHDSTDVGSPNVRTSCDYNYILKRTFDANSALLFHRLSLDRLSGPVGGGNMVAHIEDSFGSMARNENLLSVQYNNEEEVEHDYLSTLPLGYWFCPTASEIIVYYLMPKIETGTKHPTTYQDNHSDESNEDNFSYNYEEVLELDYADSLNPGYRFSPTDSEIIVYYLQRKIETGEQHPECRYYIADFYGDTPDNLAAYNSYQDSEHPQATLQSFSDEPMEWTEDDISKEIDENLDEENMSARSSIDEWTQDDLFKEIMKKVEEDNSSPRSLSKDHRQEFQDYFQDTKQPQVMAISVISVSSDSFEDKVGTPTDTTVIPTETPIITPTIPPSLDYKPASPDYSLASDIESDPFEDPSSGHIPPLPAVSPFLSSDDDTTDSDTPDTPPSPTHGTLFTEITSSTQRSSVIPRRRVMILAPGQSIPHDSSSRHSLSDHSSPDLPSTSTGPSCKIRRSPMTSVPALLPVFEALSSVHADLIPSPKRVRDIGYLANVEFGPRETRVEMVTHPAMPEDIPEPTQEGAVQVTYETLGDLVQRFHDHTQVIPVYRIQVIEGVQREQGHRIVGVESAVTALTERVAELERDNRRLRGTVNVESQRVDQLQHGMKMPNTQSRASMTHEEVEELVSRRVTKEMEAREAAMNLKTLNENVDDQEGKKGGNEGNGNGDNGGNRRNGNGGNGGNGNHGMNYRGFMLMAPEMVPDEEDIVKRFIGGLRDNIQGNVIDVNPDRLQDAIRIANQLMDKKLQGYAARSAENKKRWKVTQGITVDSNHHSRGLCTIKCGNCKKIGHQIRDCRVTVTANTQGVVVGNQHGIVCYECRRQGHFKKDCHKLRNQHRGNQTRNKTRNKTGGNDVTAKAYAIGGGGTNPDSNVVMGTFLLNNCYASMLFDSGANRSLLLTTFSTLLDVAPSTLDASYAIGLADGRVLETIIVLRGCMLGLLGHPFNIDL